MESTELKNNENSLNSGIESNLIAGGFFLTRPVVEPKLERIPSIGFLTVSKCLGDFVPDDWVYWNPEDRRDERAERAMALGIEVTLLDQLTTWCTDQYKEKRILGYPNVIFDIETARALVQQVLGFRAQPLTLLGIGLPFSLSGQFFRRLKNVMRDSEKMLSGVPTMIQKAVPLPPGGDSLGWDALGYERRGTFHASKCYQVDDSELAGIAFNDYGYCATLLNAERLCRLHLKGSPKEIVWLPWEIRRYPL